MQSHLVMMHGEVPSGTHTALGSRLGDQRRHYHGDDRSPL